MEYLAERLAAVAGVVAVTLGPTSKTVAGRTARTLTRCPDSAAVPVSSSVNWSSVTSLMLAPACLLATASRTPGRL
jgi:hypothetical protein